MHNFRKKEILIDKNSKILIGLGDSFTQGEGACSVDLWEKYDWDLDKMSDKNEMADRNIRLEINQSNLKNSWVHKICENYLTDYIPINLGMTGRGNRGAVKELYLHPDLNIENAKEKIVVFMLTGMERYDFIHKNFIEHVHYLTVWPNGVSNTFEQPLWDAYGDFAYSEKSAAIELLLTIAELKTWCKLHNATLVLTSAFRPEYSAKFFWDLVTGDQNDKMLETYKYIRGLVEIIDWSEFLRPEGFNCMTDYLCHLEGRDDLIDGKTSYAYYNFGYSLEKLSPKGYITKCAHPSYLGHEAIAETIYKQIIKIKEKNENKKIPTNII
jgi:hypothetical protein